MYAICWGILTYTSRSSVVKIDVDNDIQSYVELRYKWFEKVLIWWNKLSHLRNDAIYFTYYS